MAPLALEGINEINELDLPQLQERGSLARGLCLLAAQRNSGPTLECGQVWSVLCGQLTALAETHLHWLRLSLTPLFPFVQNIYQCLLCTGCSLRAEHKQKTTTRSPWSLGVW